jgi:hypothetical protein
MEADMYRVGLGVYRDAVELGKVYGLPSHIVELHCGMPLAFNQ